ncbi:MAG TPA: hypothetical protein PKM48_01955 [Parvularculaceae bacterium]|nr:hypothetical protein [Parvularculaceae bacterium]HNS87010.1 hypothetical protein [Parvularculaceae bacterium]
MDERDIDALERELPALARMRRFSAALARIPWFANLGEPLTPGARAVARTYTDGLGFPDADVAILVDWDDAAAAAENVDWNSPAWEAEELLRADLTGGALEILSEDALRIAMTMIADRVSAPAKEAMEQASFIWDVEDEAQRQLAVGAAVQAAHQAALVLIAAADPEFDADDHPFTAKFRLFEFGRWPVGVIGSSFNLF